MENPKHEGLDKRLYTSVDTDTYNKVEVARRLAKRTRSDWVRLAVLEYLEKFPGREIVPEKPETESDEQRTSHPNSRQKSLTFD